MKNADPIPVAIEYCFQAILNYTKLSGERAQHRFFDVTKESAMNRLNAALATAKAANPGHEMQESIVVVDPIPPLKTKPMTKAQLRAEKSAQAYFHRYSPACGNALGYSC